jgi:hypothetical protein
MEDVGWYFYCTFSIFYGHFGIFYGHLVYFLVNVVCIFFTFWFVVSRKMWQPCLKSEDGFKLLLLCS